MHTALPFPQMVLSQHHLQWNILIPPDCVLAQSTWPAVCTAAGHKQPLHICKAAVETPTFGPIQSVKEYLRRLHMRSVSDSMHSKPIIDCSKIWSLITSSSGSLWRWLLVYTSSFVAAHHQHWKQPIVSNYWTVYVRQTSPGIMAHCSLSTSVSLKHLIKQKQNHL